MKKFFVCGLTFLLFGTACFARDFIVEFVDENYKETQSSFSYFPIIYHSIQVTSQAGPKLLILKGNDNNYRNWLRQFIAKDKAFVVKIPDDRVDLFITSSAFEIDATDVHPMNMAKYIAGEQKYKTDPDRFDPQTLYNSSGGKSDADIGKAQGLEKQEKAQKDQLDKQAQTAREQEEQAKNKQLEKQKALSQEMAEADLKKKQVEKELEDRLAEEREKVLEKEKEEQAKILARIAEQRALEDQQRQQDLEQRWQELKRRLLEDEKIKGLEREERDRELNRRWLELRSQLGIQ